MSAVASSNKILALIFFPEKGQEEKRVKTERPRLSPSPTNHLNSFPHSTFGRTVYVTG